jgi:hypothetical protein
MEDIGGYIAFGALVAVFAIIVLQAYGYIE